MLIANNTATGGMFKLFNAFFYVHDPSLAQCVNPSDPWAQRSFTVLGPMNGVPSRFNYNITYTSRCRPAIVITVPLGPWTEQVKLF